MFSSFFASQYKMVDCEERKKKTEGLSWYLRNKLRKAPNVFTVNEEAV